MREIARIEDLLRAARGWIEESRVNNYPLSCLDIAQSKVNAAETIVRRMEELGNGNHNDRN